MAIDVGNAEQARAWDGDEGLRWTHQDERYDAASASHVPHLLRAAAIAPGDNVLDVGCGCGATTIQAAVLAGEGRALGVDLSAAMLDRARQRAAEQRVENVAFLQADAQAHPFEAATFDVVISKYGAMFFADPVAAFVNVHRAVRPGGRLALLAWQELRTNPWVAQVRAALAAGRDLPDPPKSAPGPFAFADPDHVRWILHHSGWAEVQVTEVAEPVWLGEDPEDAFNFVSQMGISVGLLDGLDAPTRQLSLQRLRTTLSEAVSSEGVTLASRSWLIEARSA